MYIPLLQLSLLENAHKYVVYIIESMTEVTPTSNDAPILRACHNGSRVKRLARFEFTIDTTECLILSSYTRVICNEPLRMNSYARYIYRKSRNQHDQHCTHTTCHPNCCVHVSSCVFTCVVGRHPRHPLPG